MLKRRTFLHLCSVLSLLPAAPLAVKTAWAAALPRPNVPEPRFFRMSLGDFEFTALCDGYVPIAPSVLKDASPEGIAALLNASFQDPTRPVPTSVNAFLVNTGTNLVLVDAGAGSTVFGDKAGHLGQAIAASGYRPEDVDTVLVTHMHSDHVFGLTDAAGKPVLPGATVWVSEAEAGYWLSDEQAAKVPEAKRVSFVKARQAVAPYQAAGRFKVFSPSHPLLPGVEARPLPGHTPGHCGYLFHSQGQKLLAWGDVVHFHAAQFAKPSITIDFDVDTKAAAATRAKLFAEVAREGLLVAGAHLPFPGLGRVAVHGKRYAFVPVEHPAALAGLARS